MEANAPRPRQMGPVGSILCAALLGLITTGAIALVSALYADAGRGAASAGTVERDGDHLQLWILSVQGRTGDRAIWFEKGRIYNRPGVGPAGGSSAAVACWSFATGTRSNARFVKGTVGLPPEQRLRIADSPAQVWGVAVDRRGWPWRALEGRAVGTMNAQCATPYIAEVGFLASPDSGFAGLGGTRNPFSASESLADIRIMPTRPLWRGLVADAVLMGAAWWGVLFMVGRGRGALAARRRARAGLCRGCGYDLTGVTGPVCPECGMPRSNLESGEIPGGRENAPGESASNSGST